MLEHACYVHICASCFADGCTVIALKYTSDYHHPSSLSTGVIHDIFPNTYQVVLATTEAFGFPPAGTSSSSLGASSSSWVGRLGSSDKQGVHGRKNAVNGVFTGVKRTLLMGFITIIYHWIRGRPQWCFESKLLSFSSLKRDDWSHSWALFWKNSVDNTDLVVALFGLFVGRYFFGFQGWNSCRRTGS